MLYKAIKIRVERGPVDYITSCAKFTLAENKLYTDVDKNPTTRLVCENTFYNLTYLGITSLLSDGGLICDLVYSPKTAF